jgi:hypothetical protein
MVCQLLDEINPPTKIILKFLKTWGDRQKSKSAHSLSGQLSLPNDGHQPASVTLTLSRRLIAVVKVKKLLNIEAGLEMMALGTTISSEVCTIYLCMISFLYESSEFRGIPGNHEGFHQCSKEVRFYYIIYRLIDSICFRLWRNRLDESEFEEILSEMDTLHKSIKNIMEFVFATSPLLALSTSGWTRAIQGTYLLRVSLHYVFFVSRTETLL